MHVLNGNINILFSGKLSRFNFKIKCIQLTLCNYLCCHRHAKANDTAAVRVRFAPSPTGHLHVGGLRTAFYNYLFAKKHGGKFVLRCEDTDQSRLVPGSMEQMIRLLRWAGLTPDEGPGIGGELGPYVQSERLQLYKDSVDSLLNSGFAYRCFCSPQRLEVLRKAQSSMREKMHGYDNLCRSLSHSQIEEKMSNCQPYVIRFKLSDELKSWNDLVLGEINNDLSRMEGDPIIIKSDGFPTYHLANVVDDHHMQITHVLRGAEWQNSTLKHIQIFSAFGWTPPQYAHLPLLMNSDGSKLSKRQDDLQVQYLKDKGYEPQSIISLLCLAGGGVSIRHKDIYEKGVSLKDAVENFNIERIRKQNSVLDMERLPSLNQLYIQELYKEKPKEQFRQCILDLINKNRSNWQGIEVDRKKIAENICQFYPEISDRVSRFKDLLTEHFSALWERPRDLSHLLQLKKLNNEQVTNVLDILIVTFSQENKIDDAVIKEAWSKTGIHRGLFFKVVRVSLTGSEVGLPVGLLLKLLGKEEVIDRCHVAKDYVMRNSQLNNTS